MYEHKRLHYLDPDLFKLIKIVLAAEQRVMFVMLPVCHH